MAVGVLSLSFIIAAIITWWISRGEDGLQMTDPPEEEALLEEDEDDVKNRLKEQSNMNPMFEQVPSSGENPLYQQLGDS